MNLNKMQEEIKNQGQSRRGTSEGPVNPGSFMFFDEDTEFFSNAPKLNKSIFTAFGMTKKNGRSAENDPSLSSLINADCSAVCIVGKAWDFHVKKA